MKWKMCKDTGGKKSNSLENNEMAECRFQPQQPQQPQQPLVCHSFKNCEAFPAPQNGWVTLGKVVSKEDTGVAGDMKK